MHGARMTASMTLAAAAFFSLLSTETKAADGAALFAEHCAACHGDQGSGGVGVPLSLPSFLASASDAYLFRTIELGRPGRVMPAFSGLSLPEVSAIVAEIRSWASQPAPEFTDTAVIGNRDRGAQLYLKQCAACHGEKGEGGTGTGVTFSRPRDLPIIAPALNNSGFLAAVTDQQIKFTLMHGRNGTPMVSFTQQGLSEEDINDIVAHVRGFEGQQESAVRHETEPVLIAHSEYTLEETVNAVEKAIVGHNFRHIRTQYLDQGLVPEGEEDKSQVIIYFCNFSFLNRALSIDPRVGMFLPCRITVVERDGEVMLMATNPLVISRIFNNHALDEACGEMSDIYLELLEEATL